MACENFNGFFLIWLIIQLMVILYSLLFSHIKFTFCLVRSTSSSQQVSHDKFCCSCADEMLVARSQDEASDIFVNTDVMRKLVSL